MAFLCPRSGGLYLDATVGVGGHAEEILRRSAPGGRLVALDQDLDALSLAHRRLAGFGDRVTFLHTNFALLDSAQRSHNLAPFDGILMDLGMSSHQLEHSGRGFSFSRDEPLDMRMNPETGRRAADVLQECDEPTLERTLRLYGEERWSRKIARAIVARRKVRPIERTADLVALIEGVVSPRDRGRSRIHPATRTFQALRIVVNNELEHLAAGLTAGRNALAVGGVFCVISFHSLEDRIVKRAFRSAAETGRHGEGNGAAFELLTKRPVVPADEEIARNPRARSAKLRAIRRVGHDGAVASAHDRTAQCVDVRASAQAEEGAETIP
jgi:16S rRNA (cytosine1402-N4)-methyltransferase